MNDQTPNTQQFDGLKDPAPNRIPDPRRVSASRVGPDPSQSSASRPAMPITSGS